MKAPKTKPAAAKDQPFEIPSFPIACDYFQSTGDLPRTESQVHQSGDEDSDPDWDSEDDKSITDVMGEMMDIALDMDDDEPFIDKRRRGTKRKHSEISDDESVKPKRCQLHAADHQAVWPPLLYIIPPVDQLLSIPQIRKIATRITGVIGKDGTKMPQAIQRHYACPYAYNYRGLLRNWLAPYRAILDPKSSSKASIWDEKRQKTLCIC